MGAKTPTVETESWGQLELFTERTKTAQRSKYTGNKPDEVSKDRNPTKRKSQKKLKHDHLGSKKKTACTECTATLHLLRRAS